MVSILDEVQEQSEVQWLFQVDGFQDTDNSTLSNRQETRMGNIVSLRSEASMSSGRAKSTSTAERLVEVLRIALATLSAIRTEQENGAHLNLHHIRVHDPLEDELRYPVADLDYGRVPLV